MKKSCPPACHDYSTVYSVPSDVIQLVQFLLETLNLFVTQHSQRRELYRFSELECLYEEKLSSRLPRLFYGVQCTFRCDTTRPPELNRSQVGHSYKRLFEFFNAVLKS